MGFLKKKKFLVTGITNNRSIAYGIAQAMYREGAQLAFSCKNNKIKSKVEKLAMDFNSRLVFTCNVQYDSDIKKLFYALYKIWPQYDGFIHSIAYAPKQQFKENDYVNSINRKGFFIAHDISSYSFVAMAKISRTMLSSQSSLITLTYLGSQRVIPNYNVMGVAKASLEANIRYMAYTLGKQGIRVNAISPGPIKTLASSNIKNFNKILSYCKLTNPISRLVTLEDIGNVAAFLCSNLSAGITGEIVHVNGGFNIMGMHNSNIIP
ncbi:MAG: enoyl-[acyl-carrier-protein] reductase [Candidatus Westeberhardia cardiocondylae]|nr:enoyl-[acyl-carrier-protein] reductase [Candidatus Westeberhardia cardiocondylae]